MLNGSDKIYFYRKNEKPALPLRRSGPAPSCRRRLLVCLAIMTLISHLQVDRQVPVSTRLLSGVDFCAHREANCEVLRPAQALPSQSCSGTITGRGRITANSAQTLPRLARPLPWTTAFNTSKMGSLELRGQNVPGSSHARSLLYQSGLCTGPRLHFPSALCP